MRYSTVLHSDVKDFGVQEAFTLANMLSLHNNCANDDGSFIYCWTLAEQHGVAKSKSAFHRIIADLCKLGLVLVVRKRIGGSFINYYWLSEKYLSRQDVVTLQKDRTNKTASVGKSEAAKRSVVKQQLHDNLSDFQKNKDAVVADSPVVEYAVNDAPEPVKAFLTGEVIPRGIYPATDSGEDIYIMSNGKDKPVRVSKRFKLEVAQKCISIGLDFEVDMKHST